MANAQIINNELSSPESGLRVDSPYMYIPYPDKPKPVAGGGLFFGIPGADPELPQNQKRVYYIQEDGSVLPLKQPVDLGAGGVPTYNGSPAKLAVDGSFSFKVIDKIGTAAQSTVYYSPKTSHPALQNLGETTIIEEIIELDGTQTEVEFERIDVSMSAIDITGALIDSRDLYKDEDYTIGDGASGIIYLNSSYPTGTKIRARQNAFTSQEKTAIFSYPYAYDSLAQAKSEDLEVGAKAVVCGKDGFNDSLGFALYRVVAGGTGTTDNVIFTNMDNGNQLMAIEIRNHFKAYTEETSEASLDGGVLTINLNNGPVQVITLTENVSSIVFANARQNAAATVTVRITQDSVGSRWVNFAGIRAAGGVAPAVSTNANAQDWFVFSTVGGTTWYVYPAGLEFKVVS